MRIAPDGTSKPYATGAAGRAMVVPNYPVFDDAGNLYVSDSGTRHGNDGCLFRIRPGGMTEVVSDELAAFPMGSLCIRMAGGCTSSSRSCPASSGSSCALTAWSGGQASGRIATARPRRARIRCGGNLYVSCYTPDVIYRLSTTSELAKVAEDWESHTFATPTDIAFCGPDRATLVVASLSRWHLTKGRMPVTGALLRYPRLAPA